MEEATFVVDPITANSESLQSNETFQSISTAKQFNFTACLKDVAVLEPIISQNFSIKDGGKEIKSASTDSKGCLYWSENYPYNALEKESYIELERTIEATGAHKGAQRIRLAINPWKNGTSSTFDLRFQSPPQSLQRKNIQQLATASSSLVIEGVNTQVEIVKSIDSIAEANLRIKFEPKLKRTSLDENSIIEPLTKGKFRIRLQLVSRSVDVTMPLSSLSEETVAYDNGFLQLETKVKILRKISRESLAELQFEAEPIDAPSELKTVKGILSLGRFTGLTLNAQPTLRAQEFAFKAEAKQAESSAVDYIIGKISIDRLNVIGFDSNGKPNAISLNLKTCLRNSISHDPILETKFLVTVDGTESEISTDNESGCLLIKKEIEFHYFAQQEFLRSKIEFQSLDPFYGNSKKYRMVHINPWGFEDRNLALYDEMYDGTPPEIPSLDKKKNSELVIDSAYFNFVGRTFEVDNKLNLSTTRNYRFKVYPTIQRATPQGIKEENTGNGRYLMRVLLETNDKDAPELIDTQELQVESRAGIITADLQFTFRNLNYVNARNLVTVQILPLDSNSSIESKPYAGVFDANGFAVRFDSRAVNVQEKIKQYQVMQMQPRLKNDDLYRKAIKATLIAPEKLKELEVNNTEEIVNTKDDKVLGKLCGLFYSKGGWWWSSYRGCIANPQKYLNFWHTEHMVDVKGFQLAHPIETSNINISAGISLSEGESHDKSQGSNWTTGFDAKLAAGARIPGLKELGIDVGGGIGFNVGKSWYWSNSVTQSKKSSADRSFDISKRLTVDEVALQLNGDVERCLSVIEKNPGKKLNNIFTVCSDKKYPKTAKETYYYIYQPLQASAVADSGANINERPLMTLIRGKDRYQSFTKVLQDSSYTLSFSKDLVSPIDILNEAENRFDGFFPGLLTPTP